LPSLSGLSSRIAEKREGRFMIDGPIPAGTWTASEGNTLREKLLASECDHWVGKHRASGGNPAGGHGHNEKQKRGGRKGREVRRRDSVNQAGKTFCESITRSDTDNDAHACEQHSFAQYQPHYVAALRSQRHAYANLVRSLR